MNLAIWNLKSLVAVILGAASVAAAQHSRSSASAPGGGKTEITVSVPTQGISKPGARRGPTVKQTLFLATQDEEGSWFYSIASVERQGTMRKFMVVYVPFDVKYERQIHFTEWKSVDLIKADAYLGYIGSLYSVEVLCNSGQYHFGPYMVDLDAGRTPIDTVAVNDDWRKWTPTKETPWEVVKAKVCR